MFWQREAEWYCLALLAHPMNEDSSVKPVKALNLQLAAALYQLGLLPSSEFPSIAIAALEAGCDGIALCELSCEQRPTLSEHGTVFEQALRDCSVTIPSTDAAVDIVLRHYLRSIASGDLPPREGMYRVVNDLYNPHIAKHPVRQYVGDQRDLQDLIGAFYSYDDLCERQTEVSFEGFYGPAAIPSYDRYVRQLAGEWLQQHVRNA